MRVAIRRAAHQLADKPPVLNDPITARLLTPETVGPSYDRDLERAMQVASRPDPYAEMFLYLARAKTNEDKIKSDAENAKMAALYRQHVLGEKPVEGMVSLGDIKPASNNAASPINRHREAAEPVAGD